MKKSLLKWVVLPLVLAIAAEGLLFLVARIFGKSTGEMSFNEPAAIWLTWHLPGIALALLLFGHGPTLSTMLTAVAGVMILAIATLQFAVIFLLLIALATWTRRGIRWIKSQNRGAAQPVQWKHVAEVFFSWRESVVQNYAAFRRTTIGYWERRRIIYNVGSSRVDLQACKLEYSIVSPK